MHRLQPGKTWIPSAIAILVASGSIWALPDLDLPTSPRDLSCRGLLEESPLTRNLTASQRPHLALTSGEKAQLPALVRAIRHGDYSDPLLVDIKHIHRVARMAFAAHQQGLITLQEFVTQAIRWEALLEYPPSIDDSFLPRPIFNTDGSPSNDLLRRVLKVPPIESRPDLQANLIDRLKKLPKSEQVMWDYTSNRKMEFHLIGSSFFSDFFGVFNAQIGSLDATSRQTLTRVQFPSFGIIQTYFEVVFEGHRFHLIPQLGTTSEAEVIRGILEGGRVVTISLPYVDGVLDGHDRMGRLVATAHDLTHAFEGAFLPYNYRMILARFYGILTSLAQSQKTLISLNKVEYYVFQLEQPIVLPGNKTPVTQFAIVKSLFTAPPGDRSAVEHRASSIADLNVFERSIYSAPKSGTKTDLLLHYLNDISFFLVRDFRQSIPSRTHAPLFYYQDGIVYAGRGDMNLASDGERRNTLLILIIDIMQNPEVYRSLGVDPDELVLDLSK